MPSSRSAEYGYSVASSTTGTGTPGGCGQATRTYAGDGTPTGGVSIN